MVRKEFSATQLDVRERCMYYYCCDGLIRSRTCCASLIGYCALKRACRIKLLRRTGVARTEGEW
jgi:hypothetical protein